MHTQLTGESYAREIVSALAVRAELLFGSNLSGVFLLGSLAHGGFAPESSDIDVALVLHEVGAATRGEVAGLRDWVASTFDAPLANRVSIFWTDTAHLESGTGQHMRLGAVDRADLLRFGVCVRGADLSRGRQPTRDELVIDGAAFAADRFTHEYVEKPAEQLLTDGPRNATKYVLFPVRLLYTLHTGKIGLNEASVQWYLREKRAYSVLVQLAFSWRQLGVAAGDDAIAELRRSGALLYAELFHELAKESAIDPTLRKLFSERAREIDARADGVA